MENDAKKLAGSHAENDQLFQKTLVKIEAIHIFVAIQLNIFSSPSISFSNIAKTCGWREQMEKRFGIRQSFALVHPLARPCLAYPLSKIRRMITIFLRKKVEKKLMNYQGNENKIFLIGFRSIHFWPKKLANFCSFAWKQKKYSKLGIENSIWKHFRNLFELRSQILLEFV